LAASLLSIVDEGHGVMIVGIPKETFPGERRVSMAPSVVPTLTKKGLDVIVEPGAGAAAGLTDTEFQQKGARLGRDRSEVFSAADVILQVRALGANPDAGRADLDLMRQDQIVIGFLEPLTSKDAIQALAQRGVVALSMELIPRITDSGTIPGTPYAFRTSSWPSAISFQPSAISFQGSSVPARRPPSNLSRRSANSEAGPVSA
jgi:hypothetical protein